jgi:hypothetical protein
VFSIPSKATPRKYAERPEPCSLCASPAWWNGARTVSPTRRAGDGVERLSDVVRRRARCSSRPCPAKSWTVYEDGAHPHRSFQLDVVASAVADAEVGSGSLTAAATASGCSRDSVRRWVRWTADLAEPRDLEQLLARIDPDGVRVSTPRVVGSRAATNLGLFERLADALAVRGVPLPARGPGLQRVLTDRLRRFGEVFYLTRPSPPLRAAWPGLRV